MAVVRVQSLMLCQYCCRTPNVDAELTFQKFNSYLYGSLLFEIMDLRQNRKNTLNIKNYNDLRALIF